MGLLFFGIYRKSRLNIELNISAISDRIHFGIVADDFTFFCDVAETVLKGNVKNFPVQQVSNNKKNKANSPKKQVFVYNKNESQYFSGINQQFGTFAMMTCDNPNGAVAFDNEYDATSFMNEFKLCEKDGWVVKQIKL